LIENSIAILKRGKAVDLDYSSAEHFHFCHPLLPTVLSKLCNIMISAGHGPPSFCYSYTVPLVKSSHHVFSKSLRVHDFRGISINSILSKIFEHCILNRFADFLTSSDNQFGFNKKMGCTQAIYSMRRVIEQYTMNGSTVNICALDLTKAFNKMNHHSLFIKLMKRNIPVQLLSLIEYWLRSCYTRVKWASSVSCFLN
jgi:Reverse transcriptase (RNA-dependent DNA polymerase)